MEKGECNPRVDIWSRACPGDCIRHAISIFGFHDPTRGRTPVPLFRKIWPNDLVIRENAHRHTSCCTHFALIRGGDGRGNLKPSICKSLAVRDGQDMFAVVRHGSAELSKPYEGATRQPAIEGLGDEKNSYDGPRIAGARTPIKTMSSVN